MKKKYKSKNLIKILIGIFFLSISSYILYSRVTAYNFDTSQDYQYSFNQPAAKKIRLQLNDGILILPDTNLIRQTAFIKITVKTSFLGYLFQPSIRISSNKEYTTHYFGYGAKGIRYLNISSILNSGNRTLNIIGNKIKIKDQEAELILFNNPDIDSAKILIIAPHPDDAEIAAFGVYSKYPKNSYIITITAGEAGYFKYKDIYKDLKKHSLKKGEIRTWNSITVPLLGGVPVENSLNLGFFDTTLQKMHQNDTLNIPSNYIKTTDINTFRHFNISSLKNNLSGTSNWKYLVNNLKTLIQIIKPDIIITPYPLIDSHPDHKYATIALLDALKQLKIKKGHLLLYTNHYSICEFYPFGREGNPITLPPYFKNDLYFSRIFSSPLTKDEQQNKIFALDAMNDLRLNSDWRKTLGLTKIAIKTILKEILGKQDTYYSKSVRSNELFFVVPINKNNLDTLFYNSFR